MVIEKIQLRHPYRWLFTGAWVLFAALFVLGFFQGQSFFVLVLALCCALAAGYSATAAHEITITDDNGEKTVSVVTRPINWRTRSMPLTDVHSFSTNANRRLLQDDDENLGYHQTRPVAYELEIVLPTGRTRFLANAHTEADALAAVVQLQQHLPQS